MKNSLIVKFNNIIRKNNIKLEEIDNINNLIENGKDTELKKNILNFVDCIKEKVNNEQLNNPEKNSEIIDSNLNIKYINKNIREIKKIDEIDNIDDIKKLFNENFIISNNNDENIKKYFNQNKKLISKIINKEKYKKIKKYLFLFECKKFYKICQE